MQFFKKLSLKKILKHDCNTHKKIVKRSFLRDGDSGIVFDTGKEYVCTKCGTKWHE
jgi:hypothetical protein